MINKVMLIGNLGRDPEVRHLDQNKSVARLAVATNENYKDKDGNWQTNTEWHTVNAWRGLAEYAEKYLKKGAQVYVEGKLRTRQYTDPNGVEKYSTEVEALTLRSLDRIERSATGEIQAASNQVAGSVPSPAIPNTKKENETTDFLADTDGSEDDLPF